MARLRRLTRPTTVALVSAFVLASSSAGTRTGPSAAGLIPEDVQAGIADQERAPVIIGIRTRFAPEGELPNGAALADQHLAIRAAQDEFLSRLEAYRVSGVTRFQTIPFLAMTVDHQALDAVANDPQVTYIGPDALGRPLLGESVPLVGAPTAWIAGYRGTGTWVAVLDSGVESAHRFLGSGARLRREACYSNAEGEGGGISLCPGGVFSSTAIGSALNCSMDISSACAHGTNVAGVAVGSGDSFGEASGVAPDASVVAIQVFTQLNDPARCDRARTCITAFARDIILGLEHVLALKNSGIPIAAVNVSIALDVSDRYRVHCDSQWPQFQSVIDHLRSVHVATVIAAGNDGYIDSVSAPACVSSAVSVGATTNDDTVWVGADGVHGTNRAPFLSLMAPGRSIRTSKPGGGFTLPLFHPSGTSLAAPHVTGTWALLKQIVPEATVSEILSALRETGAPIFDQSSAPSVYRRIQIVEAARALLSLKPGPPRDLRVAVSGTGAVLSWGAPNSGGRIGGYLIDVGTQSGTANVVNGLDVGTVTGVSQSGISPGTYFARIRAYNENGDGAASNEASFIVAGLARPGIPRNLRASVTGATLALTWDAPQTGGSPTSYLIDAGTRSGLSDIVGGLDVGPGLMLSRLMPDGTYFVRVRARNAAGTSDPSNEVSITVGSVVTVPGAPGRPTATVSGNSVTIAWTPPSTGGTPTHYLIAAGSSSGSSGLGVFNVGPLTSVTAAVADGWYFVRVFGVNSAGQGPASPETSFRIGGPSIIAANDSYTMTQGNTLTVAAPGILSNDTIPSGVSPTIEFTTTPSAGVLTNSGGGGFVLSLSGATTFTGTLSFQYVVHTTDGDSNAASVSVQVSPRTLPTGTIQLTNLTGNPGLSAPAVSPDGTTVAFVQYTATNPNTDGRLYAVNSDGTNSRQISTSNLVVASASQAPAISVGANKVAFLACPVGAACGIGARDLYVVNLDGSGLVKVTTSGRIAEGPRISADGSMLAFFDQDALTVMRSNGTGARVLATATGSRPISNPSLSSNGSRVAFASYNGSSWTLSVMNSDGTAPTLVADTGTCGITDPSISGDGSTVVYISCNGLFLIKADGTGFQTLEAPQFGRSARAPASITGNGAKIAYTYAQSSSVDVFAVNANATGRANLTNTPSGTDSFGNQLVSQASAMSEAGSAVVFLSNADHHAGRNSDRSFEVFITFQTADGLSARRGSFRATRHR